MLDLIIGFFVRKLWGFYVASHLEDKGSKKGCFFAWKTARDKILTTDNL